MFAERRLILLRHAKSAYPHGVPDHDRPLSGKGRRNAQAAGRWLVQQGPRLSLVLCSDATRARHTWELVRAQLRLSRSPVSARLEPRLYGASPAELMALLCELPVEESAVLVIGHEPTMSQTTLRLAGPGSDSAAVARVEAKFATNAIAVLRLTAGWSDLADGGCALETFAKPRA